jgi:RimJ/RimL family protein N-acetyltransferase
MCLLGLPALVVDIAENQIPVARQLDELGVARHIGSSANCGAKTIAVELTGLLQSTQTRRKMSVRGRELVDGRGAERVCTALLSGRIRVRRAAESDCQLLFEWANEPGVRSGSFSQNQIGWDEHFAWFRSKFAQENCMIIIGELDNGCPMGQVRFDRLSAGGAEIDISIARDFRGAGYGSLLIDAAVQELFQEHAVESVSAFIRPENAASIRAFEGAGFRAAGSKQVRGTAALHYVRGRIQNANQARSTRQ